MKFLISQRVLRDLNSCFFCSWDLSIMLGLIRYVKINTLLQNMKYAYISQYFCDFVNFSNLDYFSNLSISTILGGVRRNNISNFLRGHSLKRIFRLVLLMPTFGGIHIPRGQIFGNFDPPPSRGQTWSFGQPPSRNHVVNPQSAKF